MCIRKQMLMGRGIVAVMTVALLVGLWGFGAEARPVRAEVDPCQLMQGLSDAQNSGDVDAVMEFYADDAVYTSPPLCSPVGCVGKDAIRNMVEYAVAANFEVTITSCVVSGSTAEGTAESRSDHERAIGTDRTVSLYSVEVTDSKISDHEVALDMSDPQTAQLAAHAMANSIAVGLGPGRDADQSPGSAMLMGYGDQTSVLVNIMPGPAGVPQPMHIHEGSCANLGAVAFFLEDVDSGKSGTVLGVALSDLRTGYFAINVQRSRAEPDVYVACGDIPAAEPERPPEILPAPAAEEGPMIAPAPPTGSGGLFAEDGSGVAGWWYTLAAGGTLLVMAGLVGLGKARSRR